MKKLLFTLFSVAICFLVNAQNQEFIYINPNGSGNIMYKSPDGSGTYTVLPKNTLYSIAKLHGMTVDELQSLNGLSGTNILVGQKLKVTSTTSLGAGLNVVGGADGAQANESLKSEKLEITNTGALQVSTDHPTMLRAKQLQGEGVDLKSEQGKHLTKNGEWWYVPSGDDNFHTIAYKYDMSLDSLRDLNEMTDYLYRSGMVLIVKPGKLYGYVPKPENMPVPPKFETIIPPVTEETTEPVELKDTMEMPADTSTSDGVEE
jgi:LysM repeat protein